MALKFYTFKWAYKASGPRMEALEYKKGQQVELDEDLAAWINKDSPGVLTAGSKKKPAAKKVKTAK